MKIFLIVILFLTSHFTYGQEYCTDKNYFEKDCLTLLKDSFIYHKDGDFNNFKFKGPYKIINDTIIINPLFKKTPIQIIELVVTENDSNQIQIEILDTNRRPIEFYESWTNYPLEYCCVLDNGKVIMNDFPLYDTLMINPFGFRNHAIHLPIKDKLKLGYNYTYIISEPDTLLYELGYETYFIKHKRKLIQLNQSKNELGTIWKR